MQVPIRIVLADDDEDDRDLFQEAVALTGISYVLTTVNNGLELMHLLQTTSKFDLIVLDVNMHLKNGIESLVEIRADKTHRETFCAILTTGSNKHLEEEVLGKGADIFRTKPYNFNALADSVNEIIMAYQQSK